MTPSATPAAHGAPPRVRRASRSADDRYVGGVAAGLAEHLGVSPVAMRVFFVVASLLGGFGFFVYAGLWLVLPLDTQVYRDSPGLEAASRSGRRPRAARRIRDAGPLVALAAVAVGALVLLHSLIGGFAVFWPLLIAVLGLVVLWRQADEAQRERWLDSTGRVDLVRAVVGSGGVASYARLATGLGLLITALALFAAQSGQARVARAVLIAGALAVAGIVLALGPWLMRLAGDLSAERAARVRQEERADVAAHLHDSVLQTLALIQKSSGDAPTVARLARAQERDLRQWLYGPAVAPDLSVAAALRGAAAEVEDTHGVPVELVTVGDAPSSQHTAALVRAAREAMVNAAKHSGAPKVDVYAEVGPTTDVFVRDRGRGYDESTVAEDRLGVRNSIVARMQRHGGTATVRTSPGQGTEVRLSMSTPTHEQESS